MKMGLPIRWRGDVSVVRPGGFGEGVNKHGQGESSNELENEGIKIEEEEVLDSQTTKVPSDVEGGGERDLEAQMGVPD
jgi:hypothetical protein